MNSHKDLYCELNTNLSFKYNGKQGCIQRENYFNLLEFAWLENFKHTYHPSLGVKNSRSSHNSSNKNIKRNQNPNIQCFTSAERLPNLI